MNNSKSNIDVQKVLNTALSTSKLITDDLKKNEYSKEFKEELSEKFEHLEELARKAKAKFED